MARIRSYIKLNTDAVLYLDMHCLIVDCLTAGKGRRKFTRDFIGSGPRYIAGYIEQITNHKIITHIQRVEDFFEKTAGFLKKYSIICFSAMTMDESAAARAFNIWKQSHNGKPNFSILGGPITQDKSILYRIPVDLAVLGEGEVTLNYLFGENYESIQDLMKYNNLKRFKEKKREILSHIPNSLYRYQGKIHSGPIETGDAKQWFLQSSGFPEKITTYDNYQNSRVFVEILRGCSNFRRTSLTLSKNNACSDNQCSCCRQDPFNVRLNCPANVPPGCGFCSTIKEFGAPHSREPQVIISEIAKLISLGTRRIVLGAPDFLDYMREAQVDGELIDPQLPEPNYQALNDLITGLLEIPEIRNHQVQLFIENVKAALCTNQALDLLARLPFPIFSIGCETGSNKFANILGRPGSPDQAYDAIKRSIERGIRVHVYFIHSLPGDTAEFATETLNFLKKLKELHVEKITLYKFRELPGSPFYQSPKHYQRFDKKTLKIFDKIKKFSIEYNQSQKKRLLGSTVSVFLSEGNVHYPSDAMGWILEGGPKISVQNGKNLIGTIQKVTIIQILSDKLVLGQIIRN